jgi:RNA polymerase sigma-70 factor (ECF subfamily)
MNDSELQNIRQDLLNYVSRLTGNEVLAEDITQEALLRVVHKGMDKKSTSEFRAYLFRSAYNLMIDTKRQGQRRPGTQPIDEEFLILADDNDKSDSLENVIKMEMSTCIKDLQKRLPEADQEALGLVIYGGLKVREAAAVLGISVDAMKVRLYRARDRVRDLLDQNCRIGRDDQGRLCCDKK